MCYFTQDFFNWLFKSLCLIILFQAVHSNAAIRVDPGSCGTQTGLVNEALEEALAMAHFASNRQTGLRDGTLNPGDFRATMNTFMAYFTIVLAGSQPPSGGELGPNSRNKGELLLSKSLLSVR